MYYMNDTGITKHQSQTAKVTVTNIGKNLDGIMKAITAAGLTKEESQKVLVKVLNHNMTPVEAIAEVKPIEVVTEVVETKPEPAVVVTETKKSEISKIRRSVAILANKIHSKIKNLSKAFKKAWSVIKAGVIKSKIAGASFNQKALKHLTRYNPKSVNVELIRQANNPYDRNAIEVAVSINNSKSVQIGFLPKSLSEYLAKLIDKGYKTYN